MAAEAAAGGGVCEAANDNDPAQVVVSGSRAAVERAVEIAKARGAKRALLLPVSAPFHCALMQPAADRMAEALAGVAIAVPAVPLVANVKAEAVSDPEEIRRLLVAQVTGRVRWRESVAWMAAQGVDEFVEVGAGKALSGMVRRIAKDAVTKTVGTPAEVRGAGGGGVMFELSGKAALVTGASGGIGGAIARALHGAGATVALSGTRLAPLEALAAELGERARVLPCDLVGRGGGRGVAEGGGGGDGRGRHPGQQRRDHPGPAVHADVGRRLGDGARGQPDERDAAVARRAQGHDEGALGADRQRELGRRGDRQPGAGELCGVKAAVIGMSKSLAAEVASRGITVNCVAPGFIATAMTEALTDEQKARIAGQIPAGRMGTPEEIAAAALFLASSEAGYVTGQTLHVNGGMAMI